MKKLLKRIVLIGFGFSVAIAMSPHVFAEDTELFFVKNDVADPNTLIASPNILFVLDTSGSMSGKVITQFAWDPDRIFSGPYVSDRIYWSDDNDAPDADTDQWFENSALHCFTARQPLRNLGLFSDNLAMYFENTKKPSRSEWDQLSDRDSDRNLPIECQDDAGLHGEGVDGAEVDPSRPYAADGETGPWSAAENYNWNKEYTLYNGNYLNWKDSDGTVVKTRLEVVQEVVGGLIENMNDVNVGLMRFNYEEGGPVMKEIQPVNSSRAEMIAAVNALNPSGWTPLSETLYEAQQYYAGRGVDYGNVDSNRLSVAGSRVNDDINNDTYDSPIDFTCQKNYAILLSDGQPTRDTSANGKIENLPGFGEATGSKFCDGSSTNGRCLDDVAHYMHNHDMSPLDGDQTVTTYTVGFTEDIQILRETAADGGGEYKLADDTASLALSLTEIVLDILDDATTFAAPSIPVNAFNRTENRDDVFVPVFEPSDRQHWPGNLKKYKFVNGEIVGQDGKPAVNPLTGFFESDPPAFSYWSEEPDGFEVALGGAANEIPFWQTRNLYSNLTGTLNVSLTNGTNSVDKASSLTAADLGGQDELLRDQLIDWTRGQDIWDIDDDDDKGDDRHQMGAPLHASPVSLVYGGTSESPDGLLFIPTNDGFLHAIDPDDGSEAWAFIPARQLGRMYGLYENGKTSNIDHGVDGQPVLYIKDNDLEPGIDPASEQAFLIFGMRRGGSAMFALDVTKKNAPKLAWAIDENSDPALADLGQTWSTPSIHKVKVGNETKYVAIIGGGYDDRQDAVGYFEDGAGNAIYMIDIEDGSVVWSAGDNANHDLVMNTASNAEANATMKHSIPAPLKGIDLTNDGFLNRIYAVDMGGRIWRFDIENGNTADELGNGGLIASLGAADLEAPTIGDVRRFYATPDVVAVISDKPEAKSYLSINVGSGHRAHPLEEDNEDWFFSVRDFDVLNVLETDEYDSEWTTFEDLVDITDDVAPQLLSSEPGWKLALDAGEGEKVLGESFTFKGTVFFTSFSPAARTSACSTTIQPGTNRLYRVSVFDGSPEPHPDDAPMPPEEPSPEDRYEELEQAGIAPGPVLFFSDDDGDGDGDDEDSDGPDFCVGVECDSTGIDDGFLPTFWFQNETQ